MQQRSGWDDWNIAELKRLWASGMKAAAIADELGWDGCTKNAVIGMANRLGLEKRIAGIKRWEGHVKKPKPIKKGRIVRPKSSKPLPLSPPPDAVSVHNGNGITIMELTSLTCRFPLGDEPKSPDFRYCGALSPEDQPYCAGHADVAYRYAVALETGAAA